LQLGSISWQVIGILTIVNSPDVPSKRSHISEVVFKVEVFPLNRDSRYPDEII
jgi:hypothetical protein